MSYNKQEWNGYDDSKTIEENIRNHAVIIPDFMLHIENGIEQIDHKTFSKIKVGITNAEPSAEIRDDTLYLQIPSAPVGKDGPQGIQGEPGPQGPIGPVGPKGDTGNDGAPGEKGDKGDTGPQRPKGEQGEVGPKGDKGNPGEPGPQGPIGPVGPKGDKGEPGQDGLPGIQGPKGDTGEQGPIGPQGLTGGTGSYFEIINSQCGTMKYPAAIRNSIYRGKDLTSLGVNGVLSKIRNNFEDLFIGDYFDITISTEYTASEIVRCMIAGFDTYFMHGGSAVDNKVMTHHVTIVPFNGFNRQHYMNSTNTTAGGYKGSYMYTTVLPKYAEALNTSLNGSMITFTDWVSTSVNTNKSPALYSVTDSTTNYGVSSNYTSVEINISLLSEIQVLGSLGATSSYYDIGGTGAIQLPLFSLLPQSRICCASQTKEVTPETLNELGSYAPIVWLKSVVDKSRFAATWNGVFSMDSASVPHIVRPFWLIG